MDREQRGQISSEAKLPGGETKRNQSWGRREGHVQRDGGNKKTEGDKKEKVHALGIKRVDSRDGHRVFRHTKKRETDSTRGM